MKGSIWTLFAASIGCSVFLMAAVPKAVPSNAASSTNAVSSVLGTTTPFLGLILAVAAVGFLLTYAFKI